jgi:cytochrome c-type biogenesis protein CcmH/NrfF
VLVRGRLKAGDTDQQIEDFVVARYGEFVLLKPRFEPHTFLLWFATPAVLIVALLIVRCCLSQAICRRYPSGAEQGRGAPAQAFA